MIKDNLQTGMMIVFIIVLILALYKLYKIFNTPTSGPDTHTQHKQIQDIIVKFLKDIESTDIDAQELFNRLQGLDSLKDDVYKNFNLNRLNQLLQQLFYTYEVDSISELILTLRSAPKTA